MAEAGIPAQGATTPTPVASFTPEIGGLASSGSVLYILAIQAKSLTGNPAGLIPASCQQIVGNLVINALMAPLNANLGAISALLPGSAPNAAAAAQFSTRPKTPMPYAKAPTAPPALAK